MSTPLFRSLVLFSTLFSAASAHGQTTSGVLELSRQSAVEMAVRKNIDLKAEALTTAMAKAALGSSKGIYDPVVTASTTTGRNTFPGDDFETKDTSTFLGVTQALPTGGTITAAADSLYSKSESPSLGLSDREWRSAAGVTFSQPLLQRFGRENFELGISLADSAYKESAEQLRFFITDTVFSVVTSYNRLHKLRQILEARESALASAQSFLEEIKKKPRPGAIQKVEVANAEFAISQRRKDLVDASREVKDEGEHLRFLIGMEEKNELMPVDPPSKEEPAETQEEAVQTAMETRPDLKRLRLTLRTNELQERIAKQQTLPDLSVDVSGGVKGLSDHSWDSFEQVGDGDGASWTAGLRLDVPIGNTTARNDYLLSRLKTEQVKYVIASFAWQIRNTVEEDMRALISARLQMQVADQSFQLGQSRLEEYRKNHKEGISTAQDVIDSENDLIFARTGQVDALESFALAVATLWRDMGVLLNHYNIHLDTTKPETMVREPAPVATQPDGPATKVRSGSSGPPASPQAPVPAVAPASPTDLPTATPPEQRDAVIQTGHRQGVADLAVPEPAVVDQSESSKANGRPAKGEYALQVGEFATKAAMQEVRGKIESVGLTPLVKEGVRRRQVVRLLAGDFAELGAARKELARLRHAKIEGFILKSEGRRYCTYAGSFSSVEGAAKERQRLAHLGIESRLQTSAVSLPSYLLTVGSFQSPKAALKEAGKLMKQGVHSIVIENG